VWSVQYLETVADIVKQGIVRAVEDLEKENQEKLMQEVLNVISSFNKWAVLSKVAFISMSEGFWHSALMFVLLAAVVKAELE